MYSHDYWSFVAAAMLLSSGPQFFAYFLFRNFLNAEGSYGNRPVALFLAALLGEITWWCLTTACMGGCIVLPLQTAGREAESFGIFAGLLYLVSMIAGNLGWFLLLLTGGSSNTEYRAFLRQNPPPKFQIWLSDLLAAVLAAGAAMAMHLDLRENRSALVMGITYVFVSQAGGLALALDVCRRATLSAWQRAQFIVFVMLLCSVPPAIVMALPAWWAWRWAMWKRSG